MRIIYLQDHGQFVMTKPVGFEGAVAYDVGKAFFMDGREYYYYDEPEDNPERYHQWRDTYPAQQRFATYGNIALAKKLGVWHTDHGLIGHHHYPYRVKKSWWSEHIGFPWHLLRVRMRLFGTTVPIIGTIQAFGLAHAWRYPTPKEVKRQEWWWRTIFGKRLHAIGYYIWHEEQPIFFDGLRDHPECWPVNLQ